MLLGPVVFGALADGPGWPAAFASLPACRPLGCWPAGCQGALREVALPYTIDFQPVGQRGPARGRHAARRGAGSGRGPGEHLRWERYLRPLQGAGRGRYDNRDRPARSRQAVGRRAGQGYRLACLARPLATAACTCRPSRSPRCSAPRWKAGGAGRVEPSWQLRSPDGRPTLDDLRGDDERLCQRWPPITASTQPSPIWR